MSARRPHAVALVATLGGLGLAVALVPPPPGPAPETRDVRVVARQFAFDPPVVRVNRGDRVRLTIEADDVVHGVHLDGYGLEVRVEPGIARRLEFVAEHAGKFRLRCSVTCGTLHPFMTGELIVRPNALLLRAVGLTLLTAVGTLAWLYWRPPAA